MTILINTKPFMHQMEPLMSLSRAMKWSAPMTNEPWFKDKTNRSKSSSDTGFYFSSSRHSYPLIHILLSFHAASSYLFSSHALFLSLVLICTRSLSLSFRVPNSSNGDVVLFSSYLESSLNSKQRKHRNGVRFVTGICVHFAFVFLCHLSSNLSVCHENFRFSLISKRSAFSPYMFSYTKTNVLRSIRLCCIALHILTSDLFL